MALRTEDLEAILSDDPRLNFAGVMAYDELPEIIEDYPTGLVFNTDSSKQSGEHWISIYFDRNKNAQYMCSFGTQPYGRLVTLLERNSYQTKYNTTQLQSILSDVCGYYSAYHLLTAARGYNLQEIIDTFDIKRPLKNDQLVREYIYEYARWKSK